MASKCPTMDLLSNWTEIHAKSMQCSFTKLKATCNLYLYQCYFYGKVFKIVKETSGWVFHWINGPHLPPQTHSYSVKHWPIKSLTIDKNFMWTVHVRSRSSWLIIFDFMSFFFKNILDTFLKNINSVSFQVFHNKITFTF